MVFNSLFFQLLLAGLAVAITITYVQPTFAKIGVIQDSVAQYQTEHEKITEVNKKLADLVNKVNSISATDQRALLVYMPETIDDVAVSRDIYNISNVAGVFMSDIKYSEDANNQAIEPLTEESKFLPIKHTFSTNVTGTYDEIKSFLLLLEQNNYPLEVHNLTISSSEDSELTAVIQIVTYSRI